MAEQSEEDLLFREIHEELRQDRAQKMWRAYGKYVLAGAIALVLGVAGFQGWRAYDLSARQAMGERYTSASAMARGNETEAALKAFADIAADGGDGYRLLSKFQEARILAKLGDGGAAAQVYRALAEDDGIDSLYRDLAMILGAFQELNIAGADSDGLKGRLEPLTADTNPWRYSAREITALLAKRSGDTAKARELFQGLAGDLRAPQGVRARAQEMLSILGK